MADNTYREGETLLAEARGDYWQPRFTIVYNKTSGYFRFTNQRIFFDAGFFKRFSIHLELELSDIQAVIPYNINQLMPTGIVVHMKDGRDFRFSLLNRKKYIQILEENMR